MMMTMRGLPAWLSTVLLAGCAAAAGGPAYLEENLDLPPRPAEEVRVFRTQEDVPGRCEPYAVLDTRWVKRSTSEAGLLDAVRAKAGEIGADGVLVVGFAPPSNSERLAAASSGTRIQPPGSVVAYRCPA